jgi:hypothetical protein
VSFLVEDIGVFEVVPPRTDPALCALHTHPRTAKALREEVDTVILIPI